ncbi:MAG TPA: ferrous iron transporter A [Desulfotomaculum sp.]|nr:ferrous iron transporter A [Desulfotomaculum sp.]
MTGPLNLTPAREDYIEVILNLTEKQEKVRITDIAAKLGIAKASVNEAVKALAGLKLVKQEKYGPVELTPEGKEQAVKVRYRHRMLARFLTDVLHVDPITAEKDACLIEHVVSPVTLLRLTEHLAQTAPLKDKKEKREGWKMEAVNTQALSELPLGAKGKVVRITNTEGVRRRILDMGVVLGAEVVVEGRAPLGDPMEIRVKGYRLSLRKNEAASIFVSQEE